MKAIVIQENEEKSLLWQDVPDLACGAREVLVQVAATAVNRADLLQRGGKYPPPAGASLILGLEMAGKIVKVGSAVTGWQRGQDVCALLPGGSYAEYAVVPASLLIPVPEKWSWEQAAALPETFLTTYLNIFLEAEFANREIVLIHGGGSGVGTAAIQLVKAAGGTVVITVGSDAKATACRELGADVCINYRTHDFVVEALKATAGKGVDIVLDMVGGGYFSRNLQVLQPKGRMVVIATQGGSHAEVDLRLLMRNRLRVIGSVLRSRTPAEKSQITHQFLNQFGSYIHHGNIAPVVDSVFPIQDVARAHERMAKGLHFGKIVLMINDL